MGNPGLLSQITRHIVTVIDGTLNLTHDGGKTWTASAVK